MIEKKETEINDKLELEIIDLDDKANGISKKDGLIFFVKDAKLGEIVLAQVTKKKRSFCICKKIKTIEKSKYLTDKKIEKSDLCGIYDIYDIKYEKQVKFKKNLIINNLNRIAGENILNINFVKADKIYGYRNKIELKLDKKGKLSYFSRNSQDSIPINRCIMITKEINDILPKLQEILSYHKIEGYDTRKGNGLVKNIIIRSTSIGEVQAVLVFNREYNFKEFFKDLEKSNIFDSFYVSYNPKRRNYKILELTHVFGKMKIKEKMGDFYFNISPKAFFQVNKDISYQIYLSVKEYIKKLNSEKIIDLYSGISTSSIILSDTTKKIISIEISEDAVRDAKENALLNGIENIEWINEAAEVAIKKINLEDDNTVTLVDPPRRGLDENIINEIGKSNINTLIYISCNPATMSRDIKRFKDYGFKLKEVTGFDQFVNTIEVETLSILVR